MSLIILRYCRALIDSSRKRINKKICICYIILSMRYSYLINEQAITLKLERARRALLLKLQKWKIRNTAQFDPCPR